MGLGFKGLVFSVQSAETGSPDCRLEAKDCTDDCPRGEGPSEQSVGIPAGFELNIESVPFASHWALEYHTLILLLGPALRGNHYEVKVYTVFLPGYFKAQVIVTLQHLNLKDLSSVFLSNPRKTLTRQLVIPRNPDPLWNPCRPLTSLQEPSLRPL